MVNLEQIRAQLIELTLMRKGLDAGDCGILSLCRDPLREQVPSIAQIEAKTQEIEKLVPMFFVEWVDKWGRYVLAPIPDDYSRDIEE